jgi:hypothetical protein
MGLGLYIPRIKHITLLHMLCFTFLLHGPNQCVPMQEHSNLARYPTQVQQNKSRQKKNTARNATPRPPVISPEATPDRLLVVVMARTATPGRRRCGRPWHQARPRCASRGPPWECTDTGSPKRSSNPAAPAAAEPPAGTMHGRLYKFQSIFVQLQLPRNS